MHNPYFIITICITALLNGISTLHLPQYYLRHEWTKYSPHLLHSTYTTSSTQYQHFDRVSLYFTFTLRIAAVMYKHPILHLPSYLSPSYLTTITATVSKRI